MDGQGIVWISYTFAVARMVDLTLERKRKGDRASKCQEKSMRLFNLVSTSQLLTYRIEVMLLKHSAQELSPPS